MRLVFSAVANVRLLVGIFLCQGLVPGADTIVPDPAITRESSTARLSFLIPNTPQANSAAYILIRLGSENNINPKDLVFLMPTPSITDAYANRLTVTYISKNATMLLRNVVAADAGTYRCFPHSGITLIPDCGQRLIVVRKPNRPVVKLTPSSAVVVGSDLRMVCVANSTSLPPDHGLRQEIFWFDENRQLITASHGRIHVNIRSELVITGLQLADKDFKCYCTVADITNGAVPKIMSDPSNVFTVGLACTSSCSGFSSIRTSAAPRTEDFRLTPVFSPDDVVKKMIGERLSYRCDADCMPRCNIVWFYKPYRGAARYGQVPNLANNKVLTLVMSRLTEGLYSCKAENTHGAVNISFTLEAMYISSPTTFVNGQRAASHRLLEDTRVDLSCVFDSNPGPLVTWKSPSLATLSSQLATGPSESLLNNGTCQRLYTSNHSLTALKCEDSGAYSCDGRNNISAGEGKINLTVMCPPSNVGIPGLVLASVYFWYIPQVLTVNFVIKAVPEPDITRIFSSIGGQSRMEDIPGDFAITKSTMYDGKKHLTKFSLTSRRNLDKTDDGRIMTVTVKSSEFQKDFVFTIHRRGPPWEVVNLTASDIGQDSLILSWAPGFSGGEIQTFTLELQEAQKAWATVQSNIPDPEAGKLVRVKVGSLKSGTSYVLKVTATNKLGSAVTELQITTLGTSDASLGESAIVGIILLILVIIAFIALVVYCVFYKMPRDRSLGGKAKPKTRAQNSIDSSSSSAVESSESEDIEDDPTALKQSDIRGIKQAGDDGTEIL